MMLVTTCVFVFFIFFFKQKTAYEMSISDWSSDVCSSDLIPVDARAGAARSRRAAGPGPRPADARADHPARRAGGDQRAQRRPAQPRRRAREIGRASCRERVCQYV